MTVLTAPPKTDLITGEELLAMGDIGRTELIDGRIVSMSPTGSEHGFVESNLGSELRAFVRKHNLGWVLTGEPGITILRNPDRVRGAGGVFVSYERLPQLPTGFLEVAPELIVEVMSPTDRWQDIRDKLDDYFSIGVDQVWIVEPERRTVLVYRSTTESPEYGEQDTLTG